jgi:YD repeat-containing protein
MYIQLIVFSFVLFITEIAIGQVPIITAVQRNISCLDAQGKMEQIREKTVYDPLTKRVVDVNKYKKDKDDSFQLTAAKHYSYDPSGRLLNTTLTDKEGKLVYSTKQYWDAQGVRNKVETTYYENGGIKNKKIGYLLEYTADGGKQKEQYFDGSGAVTARKIWKYNRFGEITKTEALKVLKKDSVRTVVTCFKHDKTGGLKRSITKSYIQGKRFRKDVRFFSKSYLTEWKVYLKGDLVSHFINEYRDSVIIRMSKNNKREIISIEDDLERLNKLASNKEKFKASKAEKVSNEVKYDAYGSVLSEIHRIGTKVIKETSYTYDDYGNKVSTTVDNKQNNSLEEEFITYDEWGSTARIERKMNGKVIYLEEVNYTYKVMP